MAITTLHAKANLIKDLNVEGESRGFKVIIDEALEEGGTNKGMNPMELILCGLGGCQSIMITSLAKEKQIDIKDVWIDIEGDIDPDGFMGLSDVRPGYQEIRYTMHIKSDSPKDKIKEFIKLVETRCPAMDTIKNAVKFVPNEVVVEK